MKKKSGWVRATLVCSLLGSLALLALTLPSLRAQGAGDPPAPAAEVTAAPAAEAAPAPEVKPAPAVAPAAEATPAAAETKPAEAAAAPAVTPAAEAVPATAEAKPVEATPVAVAPQVDVQPPEIDANEKVRREELELAADEYIKNAAVAWRADKYREALDFYKKAETQLNQAGKSPRILGKLASVKEHMTAVNIDWAESLAAEAQRFADASKFDDAVEKCRQAADLDPSRRPRLEKMMRDYQARKKTAEFRQATAEVNVDIGKVERERDISVLFEQGKVFYRNRRYGDARDCFEQMLVKDPYDLRAIRYLRQISREQSAVADDKRITTFAERLAELRWKWNDAITPVLAGRTAEMGGTAVKKRESESSAIQAKLANIILDKIDFEEATIAQVVAFLKRRSQELDPEGVGVNIILQLDTKGGTTDNTPEARPVEPPAGGGWGEPGVVPPPGGGPAAAPTVSPAPAASFPTTSAGERTVTMSMNNIPLGEVIRYVCMGAGLKYRVETSAVLIADKSFALDDLETRFYSIEAGVFETVRTRTSTGAGFRTGGAGTAAAEPADTATPETAGVQNLQQYFIDLGVEFPLGSKISYSPRTSKLIVHNTPENLRKMEKILGEINIPPSQVTIEAKFIEVQQKNLQALGFEWLITNGDGAYNDGLVLGKDGNNKLQVLKQGGTTAPFNSRLDNGLRSANSALATAAAPTGGIMTLNGILGSVGFQTVIHALSQESNTDMLSAPKVTTLSGNTAILRMVTERYFPESWTEPTVSNSGIAGATSYTPSIPTFGEARDMGVILEVTPTVASDGYTIDLELKPRVEEFLGYDKELNYDMVINGQIIPAKAEMPIIEARTVETKVIIWDGETVVLGGLIREDVESYTDKVPLLGDIPLLGRLFTNTGEYSQKRNLLIFVTARLVSPSGTPVRSNDVRGLPDFRR